MDLQKIVQAAKILINDISPSDFLRMEILNKVELVYNQLKETESIPPVQLFGTRDNFDTSFTENGSFSSVIKMYTERLTYTEDCALKADILFKRAEYLFKHRYYEEAETDYNRVLMLNCPKEKRETVQQLKMRAGRLKNTYNVTNRRLHQEIPRLDNPDPKIASISTSLKMAINVPYGRHIVATKRIARGDVLVVEKPIAAIHENPSRLLCDECLQECYNLIPCDNCIYNLYCSDECKSSSWDSYHKYMCLLMHSLNGIDSDILLALKIAIQNHAQYKNIDKELDPNGEHCSTNFQEIWNISKSLDKIPFERHVIAAVATAIFYEWLLEYTEFFEDFAEVVNKANFMRVNFTTLLCIIEKCLPIVQKESFARTSPYQRVGYGLYSIGSIFNCSCHPNVSQTFYGSTLVLRASKPINVGEQCCIGFGVPENIRCLNSLASFIERNKME